MKKQTIALMATIGILAGIVSPAIGSETTPISQDTALSAGDWMGLTKRYPLPYFASQEIPEAPTPEILAAWWTTLGDETLTGLILSSLENNRDLVSARSRLREAREALGISKSAKLPWFDGGMSLTNSRKGENATGTGKQSGPIDLYHLGIDASWEIDLSGGLAYKIKASAADLQAQYGTLHSAWVSLSCEVALNYAGLRTLQNRLKVTEKNLALQMSTLELLQSQYDSGLADELALNQAKYTMEQIKSTIPPLRSSIEETMNRLSILVGQIPGSLTESLGEYRPLPKPDHMNLVGIPANYLRQRPDIYVAERNLAAQVARKEASKREFWPKLKLIGSIGLESFSYAGGMSVSDGGLFSFGPQISWPIFHGGQIRKNIKVQTERQEQALAAYEQTVMNAVAEVRNALTAETQERERNLSLQRGVEAAKNARELAEDQYIHGLKDFNNVIIAQSALLNLEEQLAMSEGEMLSNIVRLFKALGGGWAPLTEGDPTDSPETQKKAPEGIKLSDQSREYLNKIKNELATSKN